VEFINYETDVLIIGGGLAGLATAIKIKNERENLDVLVVDKGGIGWAGQTPLTGGMCIYVESDGVDEFVDSIIEKGYGLTNNEWLRHFAGHIESSSEELFNWGVPFMKDQNGKLHLADSSFWGTKNKVIGFVPHKTTLYLKKLALAKGVKLQNKTEMVELIKEDNRITGAVGFNILSGEFCTFSARATVLANGCCNFKGRSWFTMNVGEGVAAAYKAGAKQRHCEFGNQYDPVDRQSETWWRAEIAADFIENAKGEKIFQKYFPGQPRLGSWALSYAMGAEVMAGNGPVYFNATGTSYNKFDTHVAGEEIRLWQFKQGTFLEPKRVHFDRGGHDLSREKSEWTPMYPGRLGSVMVDLCCRSTELEGLWGTGDTVISGCAMSGAMSANSYGRWGLPFAYVTALMAGKDIAKVVPESAKPKMDIGEQKRLKNKIFAPMTLKKKKFEPWEAIIKIQKAVIPAEYNILRDGNRLKKALHIIEEVQKEILPGVRAETPHDLVRYHEAESLAVCSEMLTRSALFRTESRGSHRREDCPERDDQNWLKWTIVQRENERMVLSTMTIPSRKSSGDVKR
jgi:succinate dehydrogenase / fumarate reductase flavoprotein subunit